MKLACLLACACAIPAFCHVVSMSTGEARLNGARLQYELRMPLYEASHMANPEAQLFDNIHFAGSGGPARLLQHACRAEAGNLVCSGLYLFDREQEGFDVDCRFASITVPNHVHLLRAERGDKSDQAAFDSSFTTATIRFRPPSGFETAVRDGSAGFWRASAGLIQLLFLAVLVLAGRSRRELVELLAAFLAGEAATVAAHLSARLALSPRFVEAATALAIAYLAVELLLWPGAGRRWPILGLLGLLYGMYFDMLLGAGDYTRTPFLAGAFIAQTAIVFALALAARAGAHISGPARLLVSRSLAVLMALTGLSWFLIRLKG